MADYKGIKGFKVQYLSADPSNPIIGQTWYNSTSKDLKYTGATAAGAWASATSMNTARLYLAGCGTQTAALAFGGGPGTATEEYDGSAWTAGGNLGTARYSLAGAGIQTAGLAFGGGTPTIVGATEAYNGSSWTAGGTLNTARSDLAGCGTQTAALGFGGGTPTVAVAVTEEYTAAGTQVTRTVTAT